VVKTQEPAGLFAGWTKFAGMPQCRCAFSRFGHIEHNLGGILDPMEKSRGGLDERGQSATVLVSSLVTGRGFAASAVGRDQGSLPDNVRADGSGLLGAEAAHRFGLTRRQRRGML
jgi:hypothetical protein